MEKSADYEKWKDQNKWIKVRWEFMRRDPQYKEDYKKILLLRQKSK